MEPIGSVWVPKGWSGGCIRPLIYLLVGSRNGHVTDQSEAEHLEVFDLQPGDLVVTDRANGLRTRIAFVVSKLADIIVRISPSKFPRGR